MTTATNHTPTSEPHCVRQRLRNVGLYGLAVHDDAGLAEPWVERVIESEDRERKRRSLEPRLTNTFMPVADFDWAWPKRIDRALIAELFSLAFVDDATNVVLLGPNGGGKTMLVNNLLHHRVLNAFTARFTTASDMLHQLAAQDSDASLAGDCLASPDLSFSRLTTSDTSTTTTAMPTSSSRSSSLPAGAHHHPQTLLGVGRRVLLRRLPRHPPRPPHPPLRNRPPRRRKLSTARGQRARRQALEGPLAPERQIPCIERSILINHQPPPLIALPLDLCDEAAA